MSYGFILPPEVAADMDFLMRKMSPRCPALVFGRHNDERGRPVCPICLEPAQPHGETWRHFEVDNN